MRYLGIDPGWTTGMVVLGEQAELLDCVSLRLGSAADACSELLSEADDQIACELERIADEAGHQLVCAVEMPPHTVRGRSPSAWPAAWYGTCRSLLYEELRRVTTPRIHSVLPSVWQARVLGPTNLWQHGRAAQQLTHLLEVLRPPGWERLTDGRPGANEHTRDAWGLAAWARTSTAPRGGEGWVSSCA